jgi:magnesium transporter
MLSKKYLRYIHLPYVFATERTKEILQVNPTVIKERPEPKNIAIAVYDYTEQEIEEHQFKAVNHCFLFKSTPGISWINIDGLRKTDVEALANHFSIHPLIVQDILSIGQRPKMDEVDGQLFALLNMLYYNEEKKTIETEQISIVLGNQYIISFQEDATRDVFNPIRQKLKINNSKIRLRGADYLLYAMLDMIVDNYFLVMEKIGDQIELLEEDIIRKSNTRSLAQISQLKKELIVLKRNIAPVRDLINGIIRSESNLLEDRHTKYFKDVHDHIIQAFDLTETYRDMMMSMQDMYLNNVNLRMNEVMKVMAIVTCLLAPATVIGGIFGMNFDANVNFFHQPWGFFSAIFFMLVIPVVMLAVFKKRGWF